MIEHLAGEIIKKFDSSIVISVSGVGYGVKMTRRCLLPLKEKDTVSLWIYTRVREDEISLYGFSNIELRQTFSILIQMSGVGPKVALAILSSLTIESLAEAVDVRNTDALVSVPGIGKRTAEKILLELAPKLETLMQMSSGNIEKVSDGRQQLKLGSQFIVDEGILSDLKSALSNLGFHEKDFLLARKRIQLDFSGSSFSELIKFSLKLLNENNRKQSNINIKKTSTQLEEIF